MILSDSDALIDLWPQIVTINPAFMLSKHMSLYICLSVVISTVPVS